MTTTLTLNAIAADVAGHYGNAAKNLVSTVRTVSQRALAASGNRYARMIERIPAPVLGDEAKARIVAAERRVAGLVGEGVERTADGYDRAIDTVLGQVQQGIAAAAQRTEWAKDMFVVDTVRRLNLPAAQLSLQIANRIDEATSTLSAGVRGVAAQPTAKRAAQATATATKRAVKRARHAA